MFRGDPVSGVAAAFGPQLFPRVIGDRDELGYPLLNHECPFCTALALIINEWDAVECLTCSWREFEPGNSRATFRDWENESVLVPSLPGPED